MTARLKSALTLVLASVGVLIAGCVVVAMMVAYWLMVLLVLAIPIALTAAVVIGVLHLCGVSL